MNEAQTDIELLIRLQVGATEMLSKEREVELLDAWLDDGDIKARDELVIAHQKLAAGMAQKFSASGASFTDLFNEGIIAIIAAAGKFDRTKDNRFSTYAAWWVLSQLQEAVHRDIYSVKIGRSRDEKKILRLLATARNVLGPNLDSTVMQVIADWAQCDVATIEKIDGAMASRSVSLNVKVGSDGEEGVEVGDLIEDDSARENGAEAHVLNTNQRNLLETMFSRLKDHRAAYILRTRYLSTEEHSLQDIGDHFGISAERIRQIERDAIRQIRTMLAEDRIDREDVLTL